MSTSAARSRPRGCARVRPGRLVSIRRGSRPLGYVVALAFVYGAASAEPPPATDVAALARTYVELFLNGDFEGLHDLSTTQMQTAFQPSVATLHRDALLGQNGKVEAIGEAWLDDVVSEYRRFRVPVRFEHASLDVQIVVDGSDKVAGVAFVPKKNRPTGEGSAEEPGAGDDSTAVEAEADEPNPNRPQTPRPPFPYARHEVSYANGSITLAGTLTVPAGSGPFPAVLLLSGSGAQDRDETIFGHKPFLVLADHLTRNGIAVLRVDDRGVGGSSGSNGDADIRQKAGDAVAGVEFLAARDEVDPTRVGLLGHSEGGVTAPIAAADSERVRFLVLLAAPGVPGDALMQRQQEQVTRAAGPTGEALTKILEAQRTLLASVRAGSPDSEIRANVRALVEAQLGASGAPVPEARVEAATGIGMAQLDTSLRSMIRHDPATALRRVHVPVLALNGTLDLQVDAEQNLAAIRAALGQAGNEDVTIRALDGLNHLFQKATRGTLEEYGRIRETLSPAVLEIVTEWILDRFGESPRSEEVTDE